MKEEEKINNFIKRRLQEFSEEEDWNVPSDDVWEAAKPHFPKEKKRRFFFMFFFFGIIALGSLGLLYKYSNQQSPTAVESISTEKNIETQVVTSLNIGDEVEEDLGKTLKVIDPSELANVENLTEEIVKLETSKILTDKNIKTVIAQSSIRDVDGEPRSVDQNLMQSNFKGNRLNNPSFSSEQTDKVYNLPITIDELNRNIAPILVPTVAIEKDLENAWLNHRQEVEMISTLKRIDPELKNKPEIFSFETEKSVVKNPLHKWEVGILHSRLLLLISGLIDLEEETEDNEFVSLGFKQFNLNLGLTRRLNRRFSLSTGLGYTNIDMNVAFEVDEIYESSLGSSNVSYRLASPNQGGTLSFGDVSRDLDLEFLPGANLIDGEAIRLNGNIPLRFRVTQIPLLLNYHLGKRKRSVNKKFDWMLINGISLDYYQLNISEIDLSVSKAGEVLSKPVEFDAIDINELSVSLYTGVGLKYHINNHFNVGLSTRIDIINPFLSRYEMGVFYGF